MPITLSGLVRGEGAVYTSHASAQRVLAYIPSIFSLDEAHGFRLNLKR